jgi:arylsulfatase A-like enzyme
MPDPTSATQELHTTISYPGKGLLLLLLFLGCSLPGIRERPGEVGGRKPNIIVILADDLGYADVGFHPQSAQHVRTPNLEALAREGVVFRQGYVTGSVCSPTRAGLLTGRYQQRIGDVASREVLVELSKEDWIIPRFLRNADYISSHIGKWHLGRIGPLYLGFNHSTGRPSTDSLTGSKASEGRQRGTKRGMTTEMQGKEAADFVQQYKDRPFFLYLAFNAVHAPLQAPAEEIARFHTGKPQRDTMLAMGKCMDDAIGHLVNQLKRDGTWENTLLFFLSDNGGALNYSADNSPLRGGKHQYFEGGIRVPFLVCWPGRLKPGVSDAVVSSLDILPTVLAAAGIPAPVEKPLDGMDLLPILQGSESAPSRDLFWSSGRQSRAWAVRSGDWKLVGDNGTTFLFNLADDPSETKDLTVSSPQKVEKLRGKHQDWLDQMAPPRKPENRPRDPNQRRERQGDRSREQND